MSLSVDSYARAVRQLLPRGILWSAPKNGVLDRLLRGLSEELMRVDDRTEAVLHEMDPRATLELLAEFEEMLGLPDPCVTGTLSTEERRKAVVAKLTNLGGQSPQFFIDLAVRLGYTITITEFQPYNCEMNCESPVCDDAWAWAWQVNAALNTIIEATCESPCEDPLRSWGNERLECSIERHKPAHTQIIFAYS